MVDSEWYTYRLVQGSKIRSSYIAYAQKEKKRLESLVQNLADEIAVRAKEVERLRGTHLFVVVVSPPSNSLDLQTLLTAPSPSPPPPSSARSSRVRSPHHSFLYTDSLSFPSRLPNPPRARFRA